MEQKLLVTANEAAELLSLSRSKIYQLVDSGQLESRRIGRAVRILRSSLVRSPEAAPRQAGAGAGVRR